MDTNDIIIEQAKDFSKELAEAIKNLVKQLGNNYQPLTDEDLQEILQSSKSFLFIARHVSSDKIVGMIMLSIYRIPYAKKSYFDDLIVDEEFRKRGIATQLLQTVIETAKEHNAAYLDFTSRPRRKAGNTFYEKLGFKKRDTYVYRLIFDYEEV